LTAHFDPDYKSRRAPIFRLYGAWFPTISIHKEFSMRPLYKLVARILILSMVWMPFSLQAGMVGTDMVAASAQDQMNRDKVATFVARGDVVRQFESLGLSASTAQERVNALTQEEVNRIAGKIDELPAGASSGWAWAAGIIIVGLIIWMVWYKK